MNYWSLFPEFLLAGLAFLVLLLDLILPPARKNLLGILAMVGLVAVILASYPLMGRQETLFDGLLVLDGYALFFKVFFPLVAFFVILSSLHYVSRSLSYPGEYYALILLSTLGMLLISAAEELLTAYISLELISFSFYVLASYAKRSPKSNEAGLKYILLGAFSSAILLYGLSIIYGLTRTTSFQGIASVLSQGANLHPGLLVGLVLVIAGLGFKVAAVPFHMWTPDVYEGAPLPITAYISVASKAAGFALFLRLFAQAFVPAIEDWRMIITALSAITMTVGNLVAIRQSNIKRLLAYSSIGQVGYLLVGVAAFAPWAESGQMAASALLLHLAGYAITNLAAFLAIIAYYNVTGKEEVADFAGAAETAPFLALSLSIALFSLAGMPFFAGFTTKFYLFTAAATKGLLWLVFLALANSLVSFYYYLMVIKQMYISPPAQVRRFKIPALVNLGLAVLIFAIFLIGIYPSPLLSLIDAATRVLFL